MLMKHAEHGWHNAYGVEIEEMKKNGWVESSVEELQKVVAAKSKPKEVVEVVEEKKPRIGRPRKE